MAGKSHFRKFWIGLLLTEQSVKDLVQFFFRNWSILSWSRSKQGVLGTFPRADCRLLLGATRFKGVISPFSLALGCLILLGWRQKNSRSRQSVTTWKITETERRSLFFELRVFFNWLHNGVSPSRHCLLIFPPFQFHLQLSRYLQYSSVLVYEPDFIYLVIADVFFWNDFPAKRVLTVMYLFPFSIEVWCLWNGFTFGFVYRKEIARGSRTFILHASRESDPLLK